MVAVVPYEVQSPHIGLAVNAILESFIGNASGSSSNNVNSGERTRRYSVVDWTIGKKKDLRRSNVSGSWAGIPLETG